LNCEGHHTERKFLTFASPSPLYNHAINRESTGSHTEYL